MSSQPQYTQLTSLADIPNKQYTGYLWFSDKAIPNTLHDETYDFGSVKLNPFIAEGYLYCADDCTSISIAPMGGDYFIGAVQFGQEPHHLVSDDQFELKKYVGHNAFHGSMLTFVQHWEKRKDDLCDGMEVLQPAWVAFVGFDKGEK